MAFLKFRGSSTTPTKPTSTTAANSPLTNADIDGNLASLDGTKLEIVPVGGAYPTLVAGDILYAATDNANQLTRLAKGSDGQFLKLASGLPSWSAISFTSPTYVLSGSTSGTVTLSAPAVAGTSTATFQAGNGTVAYQSDTFYIGTTQVAINRASASLALTGITSVTGTAGSNYSLSSGNSTTASGTATLTSGNTTSNSSASGAVTITSGDTSGTTSDSGAVTIKTGAPSTSGSSGSLTVRTSDGAGVYTSGNVAISTGKAGATSTATTGTISLSTGSSQSSGTPSGTGTISISTGASSYNGAAAAADSGSITITSGLSYYGNTGAITLKSGTANIGISGNVSIYSGDSNSASASGSVNVTGGSNSASSSGIGGNINLTAGASSSTSGGTGGTANVIGGATSSGSGTATGGSVYITGGAATSTNANTKTGGNVFIDGGGVAANGTRTVGSIYIGNSDTATRATSAIYIGNTSGATTTTIYSTIKFPSVGSSGFVKLSAGGQLVADTTTYSTTDINQSIANDTTNADRYVTFVTNATGAQTGSSNSSFLFNPSTGSLKATNFDSTSDARFKKDLEVITSALSKVTQLTGYTFTMIESNERNSGLIAQDVEAVLPEVVGGNEDKKTLNYGGMMGLIVEALKELNTKVDNLQKQIENK